VERHIQELEANISKEKDRVEQKEVNNIQSYNVMSFF
jgi:hypothetical protein